MTGKVGGSEGRGAVGSCVGFDVKGGAIPHPMHCDPLSVFTDGGSWMFLARVAALSVLGAGTQCNDTVCLSTSSVAWLLQGQLNVREHCYVTDKYD